MFDIYEKISYNSINVEKTAWFSMYTFNGKALWGTEYLPAYHPIPIGNKLPKRSYRPYPEIQAGRTAE